MRDMTRYRIAILRTGVLAIILLAVSWMFAFSSETRIGLGLTHPNQGPAPPPSPPSVSLVPANLDFGDQMVKRTSAVRRITVKNTGGQPLSIESVDLGGDNTNSFAILNDTCTGATVDANKACIVEVTFTPSGTGGRNARLRLNDNTLDGQQTVRLTGNGIRSNVVPQF